MRGRAAPILALSVALAALAPAPAQAGRLVLAGNELQYFYTAPSDTLDVTVTLSGGAYVFTDPGDAIVQLGEPCTISPDAHTAACPGASITHLAVWSGDQPDQITIDAPTPALVCGGAGDDVVQGGDADDVLLGADGADRIFGGAGDDLIHGGVWSTCGSSFIADVGADHIEGGPGDDQLWGDVGGDEILGGDGSDGLVGLTGDDRLAGGAGTDTLATQSDVASCQLVMAATVPPRERRVIRGLSRVPTVLYRNVRLEPQYLPTPSRRGASDRRVDAGRAGQSSPHDIGEWPWAILGSSDNGRKRERLAGWRRVEEPTVFHRFRADRRPVWWRVRFEPAAPRIDGCACLQIECL